jgi:hypothetical protein
LRRSEGVSIDTGEERQDFFAVSRLRQIALLNFGVRVNGAHCKIRSAEIFARPRKAEKHGRAGRDDRAPSLNFDCCRTQPALITSIEAQEEESRWFMDAQ